jgi:hypothetical protein
MSAFMFITRSWPARGAGRATAATSGPAATGPLATPASPVGNPPVRSRPDDVDRPILRRTRRYRSDGVLGMRWLA